LADIHCKRLAPIRQAIAARKVIGHHAGLVDFQVGAAQACRLPATGVERHAREELGLQLEDRIAVGGAQHGSGTPRHRLRLGLSRCDAAGRGECVEGQHAAVVIQQRPRARAQGGLAALQHLRAELGCDEVGDASPLGCYA